MGAEEAYADMSQPAPRRRSATGNFILLYGVAKLSAYLVERQATIVYPLLLALHRHLDMAEKRGEKEVASTPAVWENAGIPPTLKSTRETILAHLRQMPDLVILHDNGTLFFRYYVRKGPAWRRMEAEAGRKSGKA